MTLQCIVVLLLGLHGVWASTAATTAVVLQRRIESESAPIFDFKKCIMEIIGEDGSDECILDCELMFNNYAEKLRDHYLGIFEADIEGMEDKAKVEEVMIWCRNECSIAMAAALPDLEICRSWSFEGPLVELSLDMNTVVRASGQMGFTNYVSSEDTSRLSTTEKADSKRRKRLNKAAKWFASQSLILLVNFAQGEWNRRYSRNLAAKRWADVPGLPCL